MKLILDLSGQRDAKVLTSMRGIGDKTAFNFLIELGGDVKAFEDDRELIAAGGARSDHVCIRQVQGTSKISKRGIATSGGSSGS